MTASDAEPWSDFARAVVRIELPTGSYRIEPRDPVELGEFPLDAPVHIVTAYNPAGLVADDADNRRRHDELRRAVSGRVTYPTVGSAPDGSLAEPGRAIAGLDLAAALELGRRFGQRAIYEWSPDGLRIVGVDEPLTRSMGWVLTRLD